MLQVRFEDIGEVDDSSLRFAVIAGRYREKWVFCKHKDRQSWEIPGGRREPCERILDTARRELIEETGASAFDLRPICAYGVACGEGVSWGLLCFAEIEAMNAPLEFEIGRVECFDALPEQLTYPLIQPFLFEKAEAFVGGQ